MNPIEEGSSRKEDPYQNQSENFWFGKAASNPFVSGGFAGFVESTCLYWTNTWKICRQQKKPLPTSLKGFYKGYLLNMACMTLFFSAMNGTKQMIKKGQEQNAELSGRTFLMQITPAIFGGCAASTLLNPVEVTTCQRLENKDPSLSHTALKIYKHVGFKGFFKGFGWALARNVPYSLGLNVFGPNIKAMVDAYLGGSNNPGFSVCSMVLSIGTAGLAAGLSTQVVDNIKTQVQAGKVPNGWKAFKSLYTEGGLKRLFAGTVPRCCRTSVGSVVAATMLWMLPSNDKAA